jgi:A/G-specific adenine glycosylase
MIAKQLGQAIEIGEKLATLRHTVTRYRITLDCHEASFASGKPQYEPTHEQRWFGMEELEALPLNTTGRKVVRLLASEAG